MAFIIPVMGLCFQNTTCAISLREFHKAGYTTRWVRSSVSMFINFIPQLFRLFNNHQI
jgi:hypothetical protein